jgi:hypothetical protein
MTIPYYTEDVKWRVAPLEAIVATMSQQQQRWYHKTRGLLVGLPAESVIFSRTVFMLAYCFDAVYGTMSWGNWLRLPLNFGFSENLDDTQMMLASEMGDAHVLDIGLMVAQLKPNALPAAQIGV